MRVLIVAVSARMLAELAAADGHEVVACDRFGDADLRAVARFIVAPDNERLVAAALGERADAVVYGAGLENRPELVAALADGRELLGTPATRLAALRDPATVAEVVRGAGARYPQTHDDAASAGGDGAAAAPGAAGAGRWVRKPRLGGGGRGVRAWRGGQLRAGEIVQRRIDGLSCSAVALADGRRARLIGVTEQLHRGFGWAGNVTPPRLPDAERAELTGRMAAVCDALARSLGVLGAFGVDAIWDGYDPWVVEVNPRPPASLELFGGAGFAAHAAACRGSLGPEPRPGGVPGVPPAWPVPPAPGASPRVKLVAFADRDLRAPAPDAWPVGLVRDVPCAGTEIRRGEPVCTLLADGVSPEALAARGSALLARLPGAVRG